MAVSRLVLVGLAACGSVAAPGHPDAPPTPDVQMIDAPAAGPLTVTTLARFPNGVPFGSPVGNITVVAVRPDGTLTDMQVTDATTGMATLNAYDGDTVTALYPHMTDAGADLATFMGVKKGDSLTFGQRFGGGANTSLGAINVTWPATGTSNYDVYTACNGIGFGNATSGSITEYAGCHHEPMDIAMLAYDTTTGQLSQAGFIPAVAFTAGGTASLTTWHPVTTTKSLSLTGLPAEVTNVNPAIYELVNERIFYSAGFGGAPSNGQYTSPTFPWPGVGTREWIQARFTRPGPWTQMAIFDAADATTAPYSLAAPMLPPWMTSNYVASGPAQMAAWFPVGDGPQKGTVVRVSWNHSNGTTSAPYLWTFIVPPGTTAINFPKLPDAISMNAPHPEDSAFIQFARAFDIPELASYDDVRKLPESTIDALDAAVELGVLKRVIMNL